MMGLYQKKTGRAILPLSLGLLLMLLWGGLLFQTVCVCPQTAGAETPQLTGHGAKQSNPLMSVEHAYRAIPHRRTPFMATQARMKTKDKVYLDAMFSVADDALVHRVSMMQWFQTGGRKGLSYSAYEKGMNANFSRLKEMKVPGSLRGAHTLLTEALREQVYYFKQWHQSAGLQRRFNPNARPVQRSHKKLIKVYGMLVQRFPRVTSHNKQAFFDHLCALDFI